MSSPLGPLLVNAFLCSIEEQLERENKLPSFYRRYVDATLSSVPDIQSARTFLATLSECHPSIHFTMEKADNNKLPFLGMMTEKKGCELATSVYRKPTNNGLLLHFQSHVDMRYKKSLITTTLHRAYRLSSSWESVVRECDYHKRMLDRLVDATVTLFLNSVFVEKDQVQKYNAMSEGNIVRVIQRSEICGLRPKTAHRSRGVLPYMGYIGMCRCEGYGFQAIYSSIGYINQSICI